MIDLLRATNQPIPPRKHSIFSPTKRLNLKHQNLLESKQTWI
jgi:hypothetical protein